MRRIPRFSPALIAPAWPCAVCCLWWLAAGVPRVNADRGLRALTDQGAIVRGVLAGETPHEIRWRAEDGRSLPLLAVRRIDFPVKAVLAPAEGPLRQIVLRGGDRLTGVLVALDGQQATLILRGTGRVRLPRTAVAEIGSAPGLRDMMYEGFETESLAFAVSGGAPRRRRFGDVEGAQALVLDRAARLEYAIDAPLENGRVQFRFRTPAGDVGGGRHECGVELVFDSAGESAMLRITLSGTDGAPKVEAPRGAQLAGQPLPARDGWRRMAVLFRDGRLHVLVDEHVLASTEALSGGLSTLRLFCEPARAVGMPDAQPARAVADDPASLVVDDVLVQESLPVDRLRLPLVGRDAVELNSGDRLFGTINAADSRSVSLTGVFGTVERPWSEVSRIVLDSSSEGAVPRAAIGLWTRVVLQPPADHRESREDVLELAIQSVAEGQVMGRHPALGGVRLTFAEIRRMEPIFMGTRLTLSPNVHHLGDEARADFRRPTPEGRALSGEFALDPIPAGRPYFVLDVADLEPAGPETPLGSPFLRELRAGFLHTDVSVNGHRVGSLNERLRWRPPVDDPQRLRLPIPDGVVKRGRNVWKIEQIPARGNPREFDDAEFGPVAIEFDEAP